MINKVLLVGRVGQPVELKYGNSGTAYANVSIATTENYGTNSKTVWHKCTLFGKNAENAAQFIQKGSLVFLEGKIDVNEWTNEQGAVQKSFQIIGSSFRILSSKNDPELQQQNKEDFNTNEHFPSDSKFMDDTPF